MQNEEKRNIITYTDIKERMRDCWEKLRFEHKLSRREKDIVEYNFSLIQLFIELQGDKKDGEHAFSVGFDYEEDDEDECSEDDKNLSDGSERSTVPTSAPCSE